MLSATKLLFKSNKPRPAFSLNHLSPKCRPLSTSPTFPQDPLTAEKKHHQDFKRQLEEDRLDKQDMTEQRQQKVEEKTTFGGATSQAAKDRWNRRMRFEQTMLDNEQYTADPREADASAMYENQPGSLGVPGRRGTSRETRSFKSDESHQTNKTGKVALGRIKPIKKAFKIKKGRTPYIPPEERPDYKPGSVVGADDPTKIGDDGVPVGQDHISVIDSRLDDHFLIHRKMFETPEGLKQKTLREKLIFVYTRNREAIQLPVKPLRFEMLLINNEIRRAQSKRWLFMALRKRSTRSFMYNYLPEKYRDLAFLSRLQNQTGTYLLYFPCGFGLGLSGLPITEQLPLHAAFLFGAFCVRSSAQIIYQIRNYKIDKKLHRQTSRPLATGAVTHQQAYASLAAHAAGALAVTPFLPTSSLMVLAAALPLASSLSLINRFTNSEQVIQGMISSIGVFAGLAAGLGGYIDPCVSIPAYLACIVWFVYYDTLYAFQDVDNDPLMANKSFIYVNVKPPRKQVMTLGLSDRARQMELVAKTGNNILFYYGLTGSCLMASAMCLSGMPMMIWASYMLLHSMKHLEVKRVLWSQDPRRCYLLFKKEQYYHMALLFLMAVLVPILKYAEDLRADGLRQSTGGTLEYKAEFHHMMAIDKKVRLEDHLAWKEYLASRPGLGTKVGAALMEDKLKL